MSTVIVLGGCGAVGRVTAKTLANHDAFDRVIIADIDLPRAQGLAAEMGPKVSALHVDAGDVAAVAAAVRGAKVVVNCTGPFYRFARPCLQGAIDAGVDYVDVNDDVDATLDLLSMDAAVKAAGISALIGMGNSPGVTNVLGRFIADQFLDETDAVDIYHAHGGEAFEGEGVVAHRLHGMGMDIPMFLDGALKYVRFFGEDGIALRTRTDFHLIGKDIPVYPYPHPEQITMPQHMKVQRVTNRGTVLPDAYFHLTTEVARLGLTSQEPLTVAGQTVVPRDFAIAWLLKQRGEILKAEDYGAQRGCTKVVVSGKRHGLPRSYVFSMASMSAALGEGTGIPAALGAILMAQGKVKGPGVLPPEAACDPMDFLEVAAPVLATMKTGGSFDGFLIEKIDEHGNVEKVDLPI